uniref:radical SAM protein n=1 Tax=Pelomicrobium sp. TaxID=2815319 RepID=UPI002FDC84E7
ALARELLRHLIDYQARHRHRFRLGAQVSLNVAQDPELLRLLREAGFTWVFVGIESPDPAALKEIRKTQNTHEDILTSIRRIYAHGIDVLGGFIVGFDADTEDTFELQYRFITEAGIQAAMIGLLTALPKTPLYARLAAEGRLREGMNEVDNTRPATNVVPKGMSYDAMIQGYQALYRRLLADQAIARRIANKLAYMAAPVYGGEYGPLQQIGIVARLVFRGILPGGLTRTAWFLRSLPWLAPRKLPLAVVDWICALSMRAFIERRFGEQAAPEGLAARFAAMRRALGHYLAQGRAGLELDRSGLCLRLEGWLDRRFYRRAARHARGILGRTPSTLTLYVNHLQAEERSWLDRFLRGLARYGDRVRVVVGEAVRGRIEIDSSVFHLALEPHCR